MLQHTGVWKKNKARPPNKQKLWKSKFSEWNTLTYSYLYSQDWVDFLVSEITNKKLPPR